MLENYPISDMPTIKEYIKKQCALHFPGEESTFGSINVTNLLQVCLVSVYCMFIVCWLSTLYLYFTIET